MFSALNWPSLAPPPTKPINLFRIKGDSKLTGPGGACA